MDSGKITIKIPISAKVAGDYPLSLSLTDLNPNPKTKKYQLLVLIKPAAEGVQPDPAPSVTSHLVGANDTLVKMKIETISKDA